mgnify:CR=1 FL=1
MNTLKEVEVKLIPAVYPHLPAEAFPQEEVKTIKLRPKGLEREVFSVDFDLKGGREYKIEATAKDVAGSFNKDETKTPYIREFENIAPLDDVTVMVPYYLWYRRDLSNWKDGYKYTPLLREYRSDDSLVMSKHIDWATGHGIDGFLVSWAGYEVGDLKYFDENFRLLLNNPLSKDIKVAILYESIGRLKDSHPGWNLSDPENVRILDNDLSYLSRNYFNHPSFLRIDGRPLVYFYEGKGIFGDIPQVEKLKEKYRIFFVSDHAHPLANPEDVFPAGNPLAVVWEEAAKQFDGIISSGYSPEGKYLGGSYENQIEMVFSKWEKWAEKK